MIETEAGAGKAGGGYCHEGGGGETEDVVRVADEEGGEVVGMGRGSWGVERNVEAAWPPREKRECDKEGDAVVAKRLKKEGDVEEEEVVYDIDGRYGEYLYERWMWGSMQENRFSFWDVSMWYWLAVLKEKLWHRYNIFYDADAIEEVYPENEVAGWVWEAFKAKKEPRVPWRDRELSFEWTND